MVFRFFSDGFPPFNLLPFAGTGRNRSQLSLARVSGTVVSALHDLHHVTLTATRPPGPGPRAGDGSGPERSVDVLQDTWLIVT